MIPLAHRVLVDAGLISDRAKLSCNVHFSAATAIEAFTDAGEFFLIKMFSRSDPNSDPAPEFEGLKYVYQRLGEFVTEPLSLQHTPYGGAIIVRGMEHAPFTPRAARRRANMTAGALGRYILASDARCRTGRRPAGRTAKTRADQDACFQAALSSGLSPETRDFLESPDVQDLRSGLPSVLQHGDFSINNIGLTDGGIVIFDWEDFGVIDVPGFDLCVLLSSDAGFDAGRLLMTLDSDPSHYLNAAVAEFCRLYNFERNQFISLIPLCLTYFLGLKIRRRYGPAVIQLVRNEVEQMCHILRQPRRT